MTTTTTSADAGPSCALAPSLAAAATYWLPLLVLVGSGGGGGGAAALTVLTLIWYNACSLVCLLTSCQALLSNIMYFRCEVFDKTDTPPPDKQTNLKQRTPCEPARPKIALNPQPLSCPSFRP